MELIYFWIDGYKNLKNCGICLNSDYKCENLEYLKGNLNINIAPSAYFGQCFLYSCLGVNIIDITSNFIFNSFHRISTYQLRTNYIPISVVIT